MSKSYLALGDSYTIGEQVLQEESWPYLLQSRLNNEGVGLERPKVIATTGWTTDELQLAINEEKPPTNYDLVSLSIGVNNQYRGCPIDQYKSEFQSLLAQSIAFAKGINTNVFVVSIPDYGVTPFAVEKDSSAITQELALYNKIAADICLLNLVSFFNITPSSVNAKNDSSLIATDGLHPSVKMYQNWVDQLYSEVFNKLNPSI